VANLLQFGLQNDVFCELNLMDECSSGIGQFRTKCSSLMVTGMREKIVMKGAWQREECVIG